MAFRGRDEEKRRAWRSVYDVGELNVVSDLGGLGASILLRGRTLRIALLFAGTTSPTKAL